MANVAPGSLERSKQVTVKLQCTFADCYVTVEGHGLDEDAARTKAQSRLIRHKLQNDSHDYCKKCNLDFGCYDDFTQHKAESPDYLHISCPWCGRDFKSHDGRNAHIAQVVLIRSFEANALTRRIQNHPKEQNITCPGCSERFNRTAAFVFHLEKGLCSNITSGEFLDRVRHKTFRQQALQAPRAIDKWDTKIEQDRAAADGELGGGVSLSLDSDITSSGLQDPLEPSKQVYQLGPNVVDEFPALRSQNTKQAPAMALATSSSKVQEENDVGEQARDLSKLSMSGPRANLDPTPAEVAAGKGKPIAWTAGNTIVKQSKSTTGYEVSVGKSDTKWEAKFAVKAAEDIKGNMMNDISVANPDHPNFDVNRFYNHVTEDYECPWAHCESSFGAAADLMNHLSNDHEAKVTKCPMCQKKFETLYALMAHCEAINSRCHIRYSKTYNEFINNLTGGFVNAAVKGRDDVTLYQTVKKWDNTEETVAVKPSYIEYVSETPEGLLEIAENDEDKPKFTQVTGPKLAWVAPHMRAHLMRK